MKSLFLPIFLAAGCALAGGDSGTLTLAEARAIALRTHPKISIADLRALAAKQVVAQAVAPLFPQATINLGAAYTPDDNTRVVSSGLPVSSVLNRAGASINVSQLITDFGRTWHLRNSAKLKAGAEEFNAEATRAQVILQVDGAYFGALQSRALLEVAEDTVETRNILRNQIASLAKNQLKSDLDASFAETNFQEAELLFSRARNDLASSYASLSALLSQPDVTTYSLAATPSPGPLPTSVTPLVAEAVQNRPDLKRIRLESRSAREFAKAETALSFPTLSVQATGGILPYHDETLNERYGAAGVVLSIPFFTGGYNTGRRREADLRAKAAEEIVRDEETTALRDVHLAWLACQNALERVEITEGLLQEARKTLSLAKARYDAGSSSIVELSQSQLNVTSAEITHTNSRYEYLTRRSLLDYQTGTLH